MVFAALPFFSLIVKCSITYPFLYLNICSKWKFRFVVLYPISQARSLAKSCSFFHSIFRKTFVSFSLEEITAGLASHVLLKFFSPSNWWLFSRVAQNIITRGCVSMNKLLSLPKFSYRSAPQNCNQRQWLKLLALSLFKDEPEQTGHCLEDAEASNIE